MTVTAIAVEDMHCAACTSKIEQAIGALSGIGQLQFNPVRRHVVVNHNDDVAPADLIQEIEAIGFHPSLLSHSAGQQLHHDLLKRLGIAGLAMMQVMMAQIALYAGAFQDMTPAYSRILEFTSLLFCIPVVAYSAMPFFVSGVKSLRTGLNMDTPIALAIAVAFLVSLYATLNGSGHVYYDSVVMFTFLMLLARYFEQRLKHRLAAEDSLLAALPKTARVHMNDGWQQVPLSELAVGMTLSVGEGEQVPADGLLQDDQASIDEANLTGESDWVRKSLGALIHAGTFNRGPGFTMEVTAIGESMRIRQIDHLATTALDSKHRLARLADTVARYFIPSILSISATTFAVWWWVDPAVALPAALAVLVVSCPCALSLATPAAITAGLAVLRQCGVLVKNTQVLERAHCIDTACFDKTGTLTSPEFRLTSQHTLPEYSAEQCLRLARALQARTNHPLAAAFKATVVADAQDVEIVPNQGVMGIVDGHQVKVGTATFTGFSEQNSIEKIVYLAIDEQPAAWFTVAAPVRADAQQAVLALKERDIQVQMISGDTDANCQRVARALQIDYSAGMTPEAKPATLTSRSLFVGDGVNDIPAIAQAGLSVSTMETNDLVKSRADVVLLTKRLFALIDLMDVSRMVNRVMRQNLAWALAYNVCAIPLAALGYMPPWAAALGMSASSILVLANATRIMRVKPGRLT